MYSIVKGTDQLEVYNQLTEPVYAAIVSAARAHNMQVVGHVPFSVGLSGVADGSPRLSIEHLRGYESDPAQPPTTSFSVERFKVFARISPELMSERARATRQAGVWNDPTLVVSEEETSPGAQLAAIEARDDEDIIVVAAAASILENRCFLPISPRRSSTPRRPSRAAGESALRRWALSFWLATGIARQPCHPWAKPCRRDWATSSSQASRPTMRSCARQLTLRSSWALGRHAERSSQAWMRDLVDPRWQSSG